MDSKRLVDLKGVKAEVNYRPNKCRVSYKSVDKNILGLFTPKFIKFADVYGSINSDVILDTRLDRLVGVSFPSHTPKKSVFLPINVVSEKYALVKASSVDALMTGLLEKYNLGYTSEYRVNDCSSFIMDYRIKMSVDTMAVYKNDLHSLQVTVTHNYGCDKASIIAITTHRFFCDNRCYATSNKYRKKLVHTAKFSSNLAAAFVTLRKNLDDALEEQVGTFMQLAAHTYNNSKNELDLTTMQVDRLHINKLIQAPKSLSDAAERRMLLEHRELGVPKTPYLLYQGYNYSLNNLRVNPTEVVSKDRAIKSYLEYKYT